MVQAWNEEEFDVEASGNSGVTESDVPAWDEEEFGFTEEKDTPKKKKRLEKGSLQDQALDIASVGTAALDLIGAVPGMVGGAIGTGIGMAVHGSKSPAADLLQGIGEGAERAMPSTHIDALSDHRERPGYSALMKPVEAITEAMHLGGKGVGKVGKALGASPAQEAELAAGTEVGLMAALPFVRGRGAKPGSQKAYQETLDQRGHMSPEEAARVRETYKEEPVKIWDDGEFRTEFERPMPEEFAPGGIEDPTIPYDPPRGGIRQQEGPGYVASPPELGRILQEGERPRMPAMEMERPVPSPLDAKTTDLSMSEPMRGARDKAPIDDFLTRERDRSSEATMGDKLPLGPDELQRGPEQSPSLVRDVPDMGDFQYPYEGGKPRLKAQLPYEYEGALPFEAVKPEPYKPEVKKPFNRQDDLFQRETARLEKEIVEASQRDDKVRIKRLEQEVQDLNKQFKKELNSLKAETDFWNDKVENVLFEAISTPESRRKSGNVVRTALEAIRDKSEAAPYRALAGKLLEDPTFKPDFGLLRGAESNVIGRYRADQHKVQMTAGLLGSEQLLLHEAIHARVYAALQAVRTGAKGPMKRFQEVEAAANRIIEMFDALKAKTMDPALESAGPMARASYEYGMTDVHEFVSEGLTNPSFQAQLAQIRVPRSMAQKGAIRYYWDAFVTSIGEMMGLTGRRNGTYLSELLHASAELMNKTTAEHRIWYADMIDTTRDINAQRLRRGIPDAMQEVAREFSVRESAQRPVADVVREIEQIGVDNLRDLTDKDRSALHQMGAAIKTNMLQDTTLRRVLAPLKGTGELVKYVVDRVSIIERDMLNKVKDSTNAALLDFRRAFHDKTLRPELLEMWEKWKDNIGVRDLTRMDFRTDRQWDIYSKMRAEDDLLLVAMNNKRTGAGLQPIARLPSHFRAFWEGDYRAFVYDANGVKKMAYGARTRGEAKRIAAAVKRQHPGMRVEWDHVRPDPQSLQVKSMDAFEEAIKIMSARNDPVTQALMKTYNQVLQTRGYGRTGIHRKGVQGNWLGNILGDQSLRDVERAMEQHLAAGYRYIGNLEKQQILADLQTVPKPIRDKLENSFEFMHNYIRKAQGAKLGKVDIVDNSLAGLSKMMGFGEHGPLEGVRNISRVATVYWLTTPRFLASQGPQSAFIWPKLIQQVGVVEGSKAYWMGLQKTINKGSRDAIADQAITWASDRGYLDPTIKNLVGRSFDERPTSGRMEAALEITSFPAAYIEHQAVRLPAFLAAEHALRPYTRDRIKRFEQAAEMADDYMVNYGRTHGAMIYDRAGLTGEAARPLKQFAHNQWGQFLEYAQGLKNRGEVAPLASFLGVQATIAGLKGVILVAEATAIVSVLNAVFDLDIPTPEELMLRSNMHEGLVFGGLSTVLGHDISSSVAAPSLPQMFSFVPISFTKNLVEGVGNFMWKFVQGEETDQDRLKALLAITPNAFHELIKNVYTPEGLPTANPNDRDLRGNFRRSGSLNQPFEDNPSITNLLTDRWSSALFGAKPLEEAKRDAIMRAAKQELARDLQQKINALDAIVDRVMNGQSIDPKLVERYITEGGDPARLSSNIVRRIREKTLTGEERTLDAKTMSSGQRHKIEMLLDYLKGQFPDEKPEPQSFNPETGLIVASETTGSPERPKTYSDSNPPPSWSKRIKPATTIDDFIDPNMRHIPRPGFNRKGPAPVTADDNLFDPSQRRVGRVRM